MTEKRDHWFWGISPGQWGMFAIAAVSAAITLGGIMNAVAGNTENIKEYKVEAKQDMSEMKAELLKQMETAHHQIQQQINRNHTENKEMLKFIIQQRK